MRPLLFVCVFLYTDVLASKLVPYFPAERYAISFFTSEAEFLLFAGGQKQQLDCLILEQNPALLSLAARLREQDILLPAVIIKGPVEANTPEGSFSSPTSSQAVADNIPPCFYHRAEVMVGCDKLGEITDFLHHALTEFLNLSPNGDLIPPSKDTPDNERTSQHYLMQQQHRLSEKLRERLGYLGVYYKRNPQGFIRNLAPADKQQLLAILKDEYREIVLNYFLDEQFLNQKIDNFVNIVFFADVPVTNIVEIHMDLMDEFSKQLKLEGRSEEILLDYRLTLIDTIAHLCEMYRRSIPRDS
ncbi:circadian clock protein KaiA [Ancylothrix sp. C2]|nr:circadian clock protein KaiA [Ancylothrix sp. D3o]